HEALARKVRHVLANRRQRAAAPGTRVLFVDDDALVRAGTAELLRAGGADVQEAESETEALALLSADAVDVLLTDVSLPGGSGVELALAARRQHPGLRGVFATAYE